MMFEEIPHNRPLMTQDDSEAAARAITSGWVGHGPEGKALEKEFADYFGCGMGCAVSSGSAALFLALWCLEVGPGHRVAIPTYACTSLLNAVMQVGATPVLVDNAPNSFNMSVDAVARAANEAPLDAVIPVHMYGEAFDVRALQGYSRRIVEDCCVSIGAEWNGRKLGLFGDLSVFSFYATKIVTCGHGGMLFDPQGKFIDRAMDYRNFDMPAVYQPRSNIQLSDINAAVARCQFSRLSEIVQRRRDIAQHYLDNTPDELVAWPRSISSDMMPYRFILTGQDANHAVRIMAHLSGCGIRSINPFETHELLHRYLGMPPEDFEYSESLCTRTVSVPLYPGLDEAEIDRICDGLQSLPRT